MQDKYEEEKGLFTFYIQQAQFEDQLREKRRKRRIQHNRQEEHKNLQTNLYFNQYTSQKNNIQPNKQQQSLQNQGFKQNTAEKEQIKQKENPEKKEQSNEKNNQVDETKKKLKKQLIEMNHSNSPVLSYFLQGSELNSNNIKQHFERIDSRQPHQKIQKHSKMAITPTNFDYTINSSQIQSSNQLAHKFHLVPPNIFNSLQFKNGKSKEYIINNVLKQDKRHSSVSNSPKNILFPSINRGVTSEMLSKQQKLKSESSSKAYMPLKHLPELPRKAPKSFGLRPIQLDVLQITSNKKQLEVHKARKEDNGIYSVFIQNDNNDHSEEKNRHKKQTLLNEIIKQLKFV